MSTDRDRRIYEVFQTVRDCDPAGRSTLLDQLCGGDPELRAEVESLLAQDAEAERASFLAPPPSPPEEGPRRAGFGLGGLDVHIRCPHCRNPIELVGLPAGEVVCPACGSTFRLERESTASWSPRGGLRRLGRFELIEAVGVGAFGTVYKARDPQLDRVVAIKVPRSGSLATAEEQDRFLREARSVAQLRHAAIVPVHEVGAHEEAPYLVSDFVQGVTLADLLTARRPPPRDAAQLVAEVADALHYAHERGVVHRDVKPSNIMLDDLGRPHLMDFGLAKRDAGEITMTIEGQVLGTPAYMSPEQARGEGHKVDGRSDVYSLGVILYELLTGELPFRGNTRMLLHQVLHDEPRPPRSLNDRVPRDLETVCLKAMAKEPHRRYSTAGELAADLRHWLAGEPIAARPVGPLEKAWRWTRRNRRRLAVVVPLVLALAGSAYLLANREWTLLHSTAEINRLINEGTHAVNDGKLDLAVAHFKNAEHLAEDEPRLRSFWLRAGELGQLASQSKDIRERADMLFDLGERLRFSLLGFGGDPVASIRQVEQSLEAFAVFEDKEWMRRLSIGLLDETRRERLLAEANDLLFLWAVILERERSDTPAMTSQTLGICATALNFAAPVGPWRAMQARCQARMAGKLFSLPALSPGFSGLKPLARSCFQWALLYDLDGRLEETIAWLERAVRLEPGDYWSQFYLGYYHWRARHIQKALEHDHAAVALRPSSPWAWFNLALVHRAGGDLDQAMDDLNQALAKAQDFDFLEARHQLGEVKQSLGDSAGARAAYEWVIAKGAGSELATAARLNRAKLDLDQGAVGRAWDEYNVQSELPENVFAN